MSTLINAYGKCLHKHPIITKSVTGSLLAMASDLEIGVFNKSKKNKPYNWERTARFGAFNLLVFMPSLHFYTARFLPKLLPVSGFPSLLKKLAFDQSIGATGFIVLFFTGMSVFERKGIEQGIKNCQERFWKTLKTNWFIWPAANLINFGLVPIHYQVLFSNIVAFGWNTYLSYMQNTYKR